jgi:cysteine synthase
VIGRRCFIDHGAGVVIGEDQAAGKARRLAMTEGILAGSSSGAALDATTRLAGQQHWQLRRSS